MTFKLLTNSSINIRIKGSTDLGRIYMIYKKLLIVSSAFLLTLGFSGCGQNNSDSSDEIQLVTAAPSDNENSENTSEDSMDNPPSNEEKITIKLGLMSGINSYVVTHLMDINDTNDSYEKYEFIQGNTVSQLCEKLKSGEINAATIPVDVAARLYNETGKIKILATNSVCNYYIASAGEDVNGVAGLANKTLTIAKDDLLAKSVIDTILKSQNITNCTINYADSTDAIVTGLSDGSVKLALIQEPFLSQATANNSNVKLVVDLYDDWGDASGIELPTGCLVVNSDFFGSNPKAVSYFLKDFDASVNMTRHNIDETAQMAERYKMVSSAAIAKSAIPGASVSISTGDEMKTIVDKFLNFMMKNDPTVIGNKIPDENFYYIEGKR